MKALLTLVFIYMLFSEVFQASAALRCYECMGSTCDAKIVTCEPPEDTCLSAAAWPDGEIRIEKACVNSQICDVSLWKPSCCQTDLCNGADGVKLSLLIMLVPLISSILFL